MHKNHFTLVLLSLVLALGFSIRTIAQNTIQTDTILQLSTCAGGNVIVPYTTTGTFSLGTVFTAQLSNAFGQFTNPVGIGSTPFNIGLIFATIPANTNFGFLYRIRVVTTSVIGLPSPNTLIVTQIAQLNQIIATPNDTICFGDSVNLSALVPGGTYAWSTGETTQAITVSQPGTYSVTVIDALQCETDTSINITVLPQPCLLSTEVNELFTFAVSPNPTSSIFQIQTDPNLSIAPQITILNSVGQKINFEQKTINSSTIEINLGETTTGVYLIQYQDGKNRSIKRIVKQ